MTVAELIVRFIERLEIDTLFGLPGAHILPVYDRLRDSRVRTILAKHEQGAAFMAGGYARASGRIGACIATAGPGVTNMITGVANAFADKQPLLIIAGEAPTHLFGKGGLQEGSGEGGSIDQVALFSSVTRYSKRIERTDYLVHVLSQAAKRLLSDRPGPVLLSLPYNIQSERVDDDLLDRVPIRLSGPGTRRRCLGIDALVESIAGAKTPAIVAGYGCIRAGAQELVARLSREWGIPVATSLKGKGVIGDGQDGGLSLGSLGVTSDGHAYRYLAEHADLILFLGAGFNERTSYLWDARLLAGKKLAQIDHDPQQLEKVFRADVAIEADLVEALEALIARLAERGVGMKSLVRYHAHVRTSNPDAALSNALPHPDFALVKGFFERLERAFPSGTQAFDDNIIFAQNFYRVGPGNRYYPNSGISSLGHAIPAAIGARLARPGPTFAILGDGGFQMCGFELMTAANYAVPLTVVLFSNATMGLIRKNQSQAYGGRFIDCDFVNPDYALLARSFGMTYHRVAEAGDLDRLFAAADLGAGFNLIEIVLDKDAFPDYVSGR